MSGEARAQRTVGFVRRRWRQEHEQRRRPTPDADADNPLLLLRFELRATTTTTTTFFVEEHFEEDARLLEADLDAPQGTPLPRRRLLRADPRRPFSLAAALGERRGSITSATTTTPRNWPSAVGAYTRKGYLRGDPHFKPQNQDRAFVVVVGSSSGAAAAAAARSDDDDGNSNDPPLLLLGVCDGHGADGHLVSDWLARDFPRLLARRLLEGGHDRRQPAATGAPKPRPAPLPPPFGRSAPTPENDDDDTTSLVRPLPAPPPTELARWRAAFADGDRLLPQRCVGGRESVVDSGSTLCAVCVRGGSGGGGGGGQAATAAELTAAWVGDSRAALGGWRPPPPLLHSSSPLPFGGLLPSSNSNASAAAEATASLSPLVVVPLTNDHKPERSDERARVLLFGGRVEPMRVGPPPGVYAGPFRVWCGGRRDYPGLAMSRAFGDLGARAAGVVSEPEVARWRLSTMVATKASSSSPSSSSVQSSSAAAPAAIVRPLLLVASDGVFEYLDNDEAIGAAAAGAERAADRGASRDEAAAAACRAVVDAAERRWRREGNGSGYCDDITAVVALWG